MSIHISEQVMTEIQAHGESRYPEEAAGLILGATGGEDRIARSVLPLENQFESNQRDHRYLIEPRDMLHAEQRAEQLGLEIIGVFHSHPDHPPTPSQFDLEWAVPWYIYLITSVQNGVAKGSKAWKLREDHSQLIEEQLHIREEIP
jgi:proteasome lid subunit RPN8/RPN11